MSAHTPGPWSVGGPTEYINQVAIDPAIGVVYGAGHERAANARLIAAAPDLLKALRACVEAEQPMQQAAATELARAAIDKAEGRT